MVEGWLVVFGDCRCVSSVISMNSSVIVLLLCVMVIFSGMVSFILRMFSVICRVISRFSVVV